MKVAGVQGGKFVMSTWKLSKFIQGVIFDVQRVDLTLVKAITFSSSPHSSNAKGRPVIIRVMESSSRVKIV